MLARQEERAGSSAGQSAQKVRRSGEGSQHITMRPLQLKKPALFLFVFFLCIGIQRLFCEQPLSLGTADQAEVYGTMLQEHKTTGEKTAAAVRMAEQPDADGFPKQSSWELAPPLRFNADWQGKNADPRRETEVRLLWTPETLFLRFRAKYRDITVFPDADRDGRRDHLWDRDVAEVFLQPDPSQLRRYKEFEVSPNGFWIDLDIAPGQKHDLKSGLRRRVILDEAAKTWVAEVALPMNGLVERFNPAATWKVNFYRVEGAAEPRFYSSWRPTRTPSPNFHVPEAFGELVFEQSPFPQK
jgi:hypothetical protein